MMSASKRLRAVALIPWLLVACGTKEAPVPAADVAMNDEVDASPAAEAPAGTPKITADQPIHDFGAIKGTESIEHVFKIKNAGTADLKLERVQRT